MKPDCLDPSALSRERNEESQLGWASDPKPALFPRVRQEEAELSLRRAVPVGGPAELASERAEGAAEARSRRRRGRRDAAGGGGPRLGGPAGGPPWTPDWPTTERTFFRLEAEDPFLPGTRPDWQETRPLLHYLRGPDICLLRML